MTIWSNVNKQDRSYVALVPFGMARFVVSINQCNLIKIGKSEV